jgi:hypothetical protein
MAIKVIYLGKAVFALVALAVLGGVVMLLWNAVLPMVFVGARPIDYLHALGLLILSRILFGGFRGHAGWHGRRRWARWQAMTPEEREQFRQGMPTGRHDWGRK